VLPAEEKIETSIVHNPNTNEFVEKVCKMEARLVLLLLLEWPLINYGCQSGDHIVSSSSVFWATIHCL
jgi:O-succinylhomoserine sulfhydrylase